MILSLNTNTRTAAQLGTGSNTPNGGLTRIMLDNDVVIQIYNIKDDLDCHSKKSVSKIWFVILFCFMLYTGNSINVVAKSMINLINTTIIEIRQKRSRSANVASSGILRSRVGNEWRISTYLSS